MSALKIEKGRDILTLVVYILNFFILSCVNMLYLDSPAKRRTNAPRLEANEASQQVKCRLARACKLLEFLLQNPKRMEMLNRNGEFLLYQEKCKKEKVSSTFCSFYSSIYCKTPQYRASRGKQTGVVLRGGGGGTVFGGTVFGGLTKSGK